jgi:hypothetical protein
VVDLLGLGQLRQGAALVRELGQALVDGLQVQQAELVGGVGVQGGPRYLGTGYGYVKSFRPTNRRRRAPSKDR